MPALPADFFDGVSPIALVIDDANFIGLYLRRELTKLGVKVILQDNADLAGIPRVDYIFCIKTGGVFSLQEAKAQLDFSEEKNARLLLATDGPLPQVGPIFTKYEKNSQDARLIRLVDVLGPGMDTRGFVGQILGQAAQGKNVVVPSDQEEPVYPVSVKDVVLGLIKAQMAPGTKGLAATLAGHKMTAYNFAQTVAKAHSASSGQASKKDLEITFRERERRELSEATILMGGRQLSWQPSADLADTLTETLDFLASNKQPLAVTTHEDKPSQKPLTEKSPGFWGSREAKPKIPTVGKSFKKRFLALPLFALGIVFWLFVLPAVEMGIALAQFNYGRFENSMFWFDLSRQSFLTWGAIPGLKNEAIDLSRQNKILRQAASAQKQGALLAQKSARLKASINSPESYALVETIQELQSEVGTLERELGFLEAELKDNKEVVKIPGFLVPFFPDSRQLATEVVASRGQVAFFGQLLTVLPELLGQEAKKTYLVLLTDNTKLRPAGGTVEAAGFLSFEKGRLINLEVKGVEVIDSQLKGQIAAPDPLAKYLELANWNLENSGWSADFPTSAARAAWFVSQELEQKVDGVISFDLEFVRAVLETLGKLELENGEAVNATNVLSKAQFSNKDFFPQLNRAVLKHLTTESSLDFLLAAAKAKHLSFWFNTPRVQTVFAKEGLDGAVRSVTCQQAVQFENCLTDYLQIVDADLGKDKISHLVEKSHSLEIDIKSGTLAHKMTVALKNTAVTGPYNSYLRLYVPATSALSLAAVVNPQSGEQTTLAADIGSDRGKRTYGVYVQIPQGESRQLVFLWDITTARPCPDCNEGELVFLWQRQQGAFEAPYALRINLPATDLRVGAYPAPSLTGEGTVGYNNNLSGDLPVNIIWQHK